MKNPCRECLVQAACTFICDKKNDYTEVVVEHLIHVCNLYIYDKEGNVKTSISKEHLIVHQKAIEQCRQNSVDNQGIMDRGIII